MREVVSNAYESRSMEVVCKERGWEIVVRYGAHIAIIKDKEASHE